LVLGFLIFIFNSKHPDGVGARGHVHTNKFRLCKTVQTEQPVARNIPKIVTRRRTSDSGCLRDGHLEHGRHFGQHFARFRDEITFVAQGGWEAFGISVWDKAENPEAFNRDKYPEVTKSLATVVQAIWVALSQANVNANRCVRMQGLRELKCHSATNLGPRSSGRTRFAGRLDDRE